MFNPDSKTGNKKERGSDYGTPVAGSKTAQRGQAAHSRISHEIVELCSVIEDSGKKVNVEGSNSVAVITFGRLFEIYTHISNKVVGVLLRARKYGLVAFEGETLFQRRDDDVVITLLVTSAKARELAREGKDDVHWGKCMTWSIEEIRGSWMELFSNRIGPTCMEKCHACSA